MPRDDDFEEDDDEMSIEEEGFLAGYKEAQKKKNAPKGPSGFVEPDDFDDEKLEEE